MVKRSWCVLAGVICVSAAIAVSAPAACHAASPAPVVLTAAPGPTQRVGRVVPTVLPATYDCPALAGLVPLPGAAGPATCSCSPVASTTVLRPLPPATIPVRSAPVRPVPARPTVRVFRPVLPLVPPAPPSGYVVGRGLIGQPKLYLPGQPVRNFLRYLSL